MSEFRASYEQSLNNQIEEQLSISLRRNGLMSVVVPDVGRFDNEDASEPVGFSLTDPAPQFYFQRDDMPFTQLLNLFCMGTIQRASDAGGAVIWSALPVFLLGVQGPGDHRITSRAWFCPRDTALRIIDMPYAENWPTHNLDIGYLISDRGRASEPRDVAVSNPYGSFGKDVRLRIVTPVDAWKHNG